MHTHAHSLTHTHTHTHSLSLSHTHTLTISLSLSHTHTHTLSHTHTHTHTQPVFKVDMVFVEEEARIGYHPPLPAFKHSVIDLVNLMVRSCKGEEW